MKHKQILKLEAREAHGLGGFFVCFITFLAIGLFMSSQIKEKIEQELKKLSGISIISLVHDLIIYAHSIRSSDIHLDPTESVLRVRFRVDGALQEVFRFPKKIHHEVISRVKILSGLRTDEHQAAQDGRFRLDLEGQSPLDVRVSIAPTFYG